MNKLNNKGFAITTLLYGLLSVAFLIMTLLMGIMSTNRQNTKSLIDRIEDELNRYGETETTFGFTGEMQEYIVPYGQEGWYKIELWGAKTSAGLGDYTSGIVYLGVNAPLYFYIGETCTSDCDSKFNKGNTEVRLTPTLASGLWNDTDSIRNTLMRASGTDATFVAGMSGMNAVNISGTLTYQTKLESSEKYFINGFHIKNVNDGNGKANVELVSKNGASNPPQIKNYKLDNVRYIRNCTNGNEQNGGNHILEIQAIKLGTGENIAKGKTISMTTGGTPTNTGYATDGTLNNTSTYTSLPSGQSCYKIDLGSPNNLSEITVWNYFYNNKAPGASGYDTNFRGYYSHTIEVSSDGTNWTVLKDKTGTKNPSARETERGTRITRWNPDVTSDTFPAGNYYILSAKGGNQVLSSQSDGSVTIDTFSGEKRQKWTIEPVDINNTYVANKTAYDGKKLYKIYESQDLKALQIDEGTAEDGERGMTHQTYRGYEWDIWEIIPRKDGTYYIKSLLGTYLTSNTNLYEIGGWTQLYSHRGDFQDAAQTIPDYTQRWMFVNAEY